VPGLEDRSMNESDFIWAQPSRCRCCDYPVGQGGEFCLNCGTSLVFWSTSTLKQFLSFSGRMTVYGALIVLGLYLSYQASPLLLLFPLLCVFGQSQER